MSEARAIAQVLVATPERQAEAQSDALWVERVKAGQVSAFDHLMVKYRERVYSVIYNLTSNREDAADLTQETFIKAFQSIQSFQGGSSFFTWLYRIAVNGTLSYLRKHRLRRFFSLESLPPESVPEDLLEALVLKADQGKATLVRELQEKLNEAFQKLSLDHRTVVTLFEIEGLSHREIAEVMGCSEGTVRSRLHYAKLQLQAELSHYLR